MQRSHRRRDAAVIAVIGACLLAACASEPSGPPQVEAPDPDPTAASQPEPVPDDEPTAEPEQPPSPEPPSPATVDAYGVSAGDTAAVEAGMSILARGGNAADAAVATAFAVSVVEPFASGIGGGGAAVVAGVGAPPAAYNYREVVAADGSVPASGTGVPGFVAGMAELHAQHGTLDFAELVRPAIDLARDGTATSELVADQLRGAAYRLPTSSMPAFFPEGAPLSAGDPLVQPRLADTLDTIAEDGPDEFYRGELADALGSAVDGIDAASLEAYEVQSTPPSTGTLAGYEVVAAPPPLSGTTLIQMLQLAEAKDIDQRSPGSADHIHTLSMAWRVAEEYRADELGDPAFVGVPPPERTDADTNAALAEAIPMDRFVDVGDVREAEPSVGNTTHLTVVDAEGTMVSMTNSLSNFWGSGQYEQGFFLNSHLSRVSGDGSALQPGQRLASSSTPVIVRDGDGVPVLGLGSPGGRRIPNVLSQVLVGWALQGRSLQEAVDQPRFHLEDRDLQVEELPDEEVAAELRSRGYASLGVPDSPYYFGSVQALEVDVEDDEVRGGRDPRRAADWDAARG